MKINWGKGILIAIILFLIISFLMIYYFMNQKVDLVTANYYEKTLTYQEQIDQAKRSQDINKVVTMEYSNNQLKIVFPQGMNNKIKDAEIYFYRPSDSNMDFNFNYDLNEKSELNIDLSKIQKGYWKIQLKWMMNNESYSIERVLMLD